MFENLTRRLKGSRPEIQKTLVKKPRFPCPFYGFHEAFNIFVDQCGNQCPLMDHTCQMADCPSGPNWNKCPFNCKKNKEALNNIFYGHRIVPNEFWPKGQSSWDGMLFQTWMEYVMDPNTPRPGKHVDEKNDKPN